MNRLDYRKGRYVSYDYQAKGDRFTRGLSETPRLLTTVTSYESGRRFKRRVRTNALPSYSVNQLFTGKVLKAAKELVEQGKGELYLGFKDGRLHIDLEPPGTPIKLELSEQHKGKRLWFVCPHCERRVNTLYVHRETYFNLWGCQKCFGLSYPSQYAHKSKGLDMAIIQRKVEVSLGAFSRAHEREHKRLLKMSAQLEKLMGGGR